MSPLAQTKFSQAWHGLQARRPNGLWLLVGFLFLPFVAYQTVIPAAAWLAPVFLLRFMRQSPRPRRALLLIFCAYATSIVIASRGEISPVLFELVLGILCMPLGRGILYTLPYAADRLLSPYLRKWQRVFVFPAAFVTVEFAVSPLGFMGTWGSAAYSQYENLPLMQVASLVGIWGVTFLIMWFASIVNALWERDFDLRPVRELVGLFAAVLLAALLWGSARLNFAAPSSPTAQAATITIDAAIHDQALSAVDWVTFNQSTDEERARARPKFEATVDHMLARTETALRGGAKIVGWQEASGLVLEEDKQSVLDKASAMAKRYGAYLQIWLAVFTRAPAWPYVHNQSILIDDTGKVVWTYDKAHPLTGGESLVTFAGPGRLPVADTPYGRMSTVICYDSDFPALLRQAGRQDMDILFLPSDDSRPWAQANITRGFYRAIENGFSMVRAGGRGWSIIADYQGRTLGRQDYFTSGSGIMLASIPTQGVSTIYSRIGDAFAYLCVAGLLMLAGIAWAGRARPAG